MASIYSTLLYAGIKASGAADLVYTVPADMVAIMTCAAIAPQAAGAALGVVYHSGSVILAKCNSGVQYGVEVTNGRWVFNAGDTIYAAAFSQGFSFHLSGYLLSV